MLIGKLVSMYTPSPAFAVLVFTPLLSCISSLVPAGTVMILGDADCSDAFCVSATDEHSRREATSKRMRATSERRRQIRSYDTTFQPRVPTPSRHCQPS